MVAASIRSNNPGAMWGKGNKIAAKWGSTTTAMLADGLGQGNNIAYFPTPVQGACAQFDLWQTGYCNMTLRNAILKWSGHNWSDPYANFLVQRSGLSLETVITRNILASEQGLRLIVAQAQWEAGAVYPLTNAQWVTAQNKVFLQTPAPATPAQKKIAASGAVVVATGGAVVTAAKQGSHWSILLFILLGGAIAAVAVWLVVHHSHEVATTNPSPLPPGAGPAGGLRPVVPSSNVPPGV